MITSAEAVRIVQAEFDLHEPGRAFHVRRLDRPGDAYFLVILGEEGAAMTVAAVGELDGEIRTSARLKGDVAHMTVDKEQALELARLWDTPEAELVWRPCQASMSPLYPIWEVKSASGTLYVDQSRGVHEQLQAGGPG